MLIPEILKITLSYTDIAKETVGLYVAFVWVLGPGSWVLGPSRPWEHQEMGWGEGSNRGAEAASLGVQGSQAYKLRAGDIKA